MTPSAITEPIDALFLLCFSGDSEYFLSQFDRLLESADNFQECVNTLINLLFPNKK
jgi:hypothetical protein